ncbi:uncharacterized protein TNCV_5110801 [Trichonephila clavipes]|nr:uncharacterized protein TNCV_5110801 [Trichonephila clavipes]
MNRGKKLSDGKCISGKNRLTDKFIDTITTYYGNAIRQNNSSVSDMRQAIWAIYCHYRSTDEEPMHHFCPIGDTSWCKYQKAVATNSASLFKHKNIVPIAVMDEIKPIIAELSAPKLLKKCVGGKTQNANESFNSTVWNSRRLHENAAKEEVSASGSNEICVSGDGTWKTRGHTSRIGVCSVIGDVTGKVIDVAVLSSYCKGCEKWRGPKSGHSYEEWKLKHQPHCVKNHIGSSSKMEVDGMKEIFQRSVPQ